MMLYLKHCEKKYPNLVADAVKAAEIGTRWASMPIPPDQAIWIDKSAAYTKKEAIFADGESVALEEMAIEYGKMKSEVFFLKGQVKVLHAVIQSQNEDREILLNDMKELETINGILCDKLERPQ